MHYALTLRRSLNWSQTEMARYLGCDQGTVSRIENGGPVNGSLNRLLSILQRDFAEGKVTRTGERKRALTVTPARTEESGTEIESATQKPGGGVAGGRGAGDGVSAPIAS